MIKVLCLTLLLIVMWSCSVQTSSAANEGGTGIGVQFGYPGNVGLSLRFDNVAVGAAWNLGGNGYLHATVDYWMIKNDLAKDLDWYLGPGLNIGIGNPFILGVRLPVGLQWMPVNRIEIFGELAPCLWLIDNVSFNWNGAVGVRYIL